MYPLFNYTYIIANGPFLVNLLLLVNNCMKTLREYIDQLDEISRRGFLKGAGAAAVSGAVGTGSLFPKTAKAEYSTYSLTEDDVQYIMALLAMIYFGMYGKLRNRAIPAAARNVLRNLKEIATPTLDFLTDVYIMDSIEKIRNSRPEQYDILYQIAQDPEAPIRIMNRVLRIQDNFINGMSPQNRQRYANETGHTIQMREEKNEDLDEASADAVKRIEQLVRYK